MESEERTIDSIRAALRHDSEILTKNIEYIDAYEKALTKIDKDAELLDKWSASDDPEDREKARVYLIDMIKSGISDFLHGLTE